MRLSSQNTRHLNEGHQDGPGKMARLLSGRMIVLASLAAALAAPVSAQNKPTKFDLHCELKIYPSGMRVQLKVDLDESRLLDDKMTEWTPVKQTTERLSASREYDVRGKKVRRDLEINRVTGELSVRHTTENETGVEFSGPCRVDRYTGPGADSLF
ncbi:MAG: hypothetical protein EON58_13005 [Alphaproteobacteria bacterium]|nr:MAG: hypothetical protein EON58_13005 [Alphaproteobacteria bacterium]